MKKQYLKGERGENEVKSEEDLEMVHREQRMEAKLTGRKPSAGSYW